MVPLMFYLLGMPMHLVVGTNLFQEAFLCANVTFVQVVSNHVVDLMRPHIVRGLNPSGDFLGAGLGR